MLQQIVKNELWRRGNLTWKLHPLQKEMYEIYKNAPQRSKLVWLLGRQSGKSYMLCCLAIETALQFPNAVVKIVTDTKIHAKNIIEPAIQEILRDCPEELKPVYHKADYEYVFSNGSKIQLAGSDGGHIEKLRGQKCRAIFIDEAGFCSDLENAVNSVLLPTTTHTGGKIVLASTPPLDEDHDFWKFVESADLDGLLTKKTIYDNTILSEDTKLNIIKSMGGVQNERFRREYLCEKIRSEHNTVIPEFNEDLKKDIIIDTPKPQFFDAFVSMDLGFHDLTAVLFGHYDFKNNRLVIEDEMALSGHQIHLKVLGKDILNKEAELWSNVQTGDVVKPRRVADHNLVATNEIAKATNYQVTFENAEKTDKDTAINNLRTLLHSRRIIISPKCKTLIRHLQYCQWDKSKPGKQYARSADNAHYDFVDALLYMSRSIHWNKNPYPRHYNMDVNNSIILGASNNPVNGVQQSNIDVFKKIFNRK